MICRKCRQEAPEGLYCSLCGAKQSVSPKLEKSTRHRGNGTGTVFKRGKTWTAQRTLYITVDENGKLHRKYATKGGFSTKRDAIIYLESMLDSESRTTPKLVDLWNIYEQTELPKLSKDKQTAYKKARQRLECIIGRKIDTLTTTDLQETINRECPSYYTAKDCKTVLSKLYQSACADQFVPSNLAEYIKLPTLEEKDAVPFTGDEVDKMWSAFADGDLFVGYLLVMIYSGMMPGELLALKKSMIDFDKCEIYGNGKKTKIRKQNAIVFAECVRPVLEELINNADGDKLVRRQKDAWYRDYHDAVKRIGVRDLPPYSCRHTTGTEAARLNLNASIIQKIMRHSRITTSQRYIHLGSEEAHSGTNQLFHNKQVKNL